MTSLSSLAARALALAVTAVAPHLHAAPATLLFQDEFNAGIPGWTQVQPAGTYIDGPMRWQYDIVSQSFIEQSNIYTDNAAASPTATAVMLINSANAGGTFSYKARLIAGDDDAFGLIFGYVNANTFFRVSFSRQIRTSPGFPWNGWNVDQKINNLTTNLFGDGVDGVPDPAPSFINTQYVPFDVTIGVTNGLFSLTVLDDPEGFATEHKLVEAKPITGLPSNGGRVGMFTWGQSGTTVRGFRIKNLSLAPTPLAGNPNALTNWTAVVTPRADGSGLDSGGNGGQPIWSLALGQNGPFGTLHENSDAFGGNDGQGQVDFPAASIVAGDANWTDYVLKARILPADDDGHGVLVRYKDERNFYRVALRSQASSTGPRQGLSIQKVVEGIFEEIYFDETVKYNPVANTPYEITVAVVGNRLQALVIGAPGTTNASTHVYGPFLLEGATIPKGKIGFFSWGMSRVEFDWVRVYSIDGVPLEISSAFGSPEPAAGLSGFAPGTVITATAPSPAPGPIPGIRHVVTGWSGLGSVPTSGTANQVTFTLNDISLLNWNWRTEYQAVVNSAPGGTVTGVPAEWLPAGTALAIRAEPAAGQVFTGWAGSSISANPLLNIQLNGPLNLTPRFEADSDGDGLADSWEQANFGNLQAGPGADADNDGVSNLDEFRRGSSPTAAETPLAPNPLTSRWENVQRDPALPGQLVVRDFGNGFRGAWDNSNDFREAEGANVWIPAEQRLANVSFEGPRLIIDSNIWQSSWSNYTASAIFSVADDDGNSVYFRYRNESNWYRATIVGENNPAVWRAPFGLSVQKRSNGMFTEIARDESIATDPRDTSFYKRLRLTVTANGPDYTVKATGWNANISPAGWDESTAATITFTDTDHPTGRFGVGVWGQGGGNNATDSNPVSVGVLIEDVVANVGGTDVFTETWDALPLAAELPNGWNNPFAGTAAAGTWQRSAHGAIIQTGNFAPQTTASATTPKADAESSVLVGSEFQAPSYLARIGIHPFDDDGIGFVYDYKDTNNFARVMFVSEASAPGRIPQGLSVSRKENGIWRDIVAGENSFVYTPGQPFIAEFTRLAAMSRLTVREVDRPEVAHTWGWAESAPGTATNRVGVTVWGQQDGHFTELSVASVSGTTTPAPLRITGASISGGNLVLQIANPGGASFDVQASATLEAGSWNTVATAQTGSTWSAPLTGQKMFFRLASR